MQSVILNMHITVVVNIFIIDYSFLTDHTALLCLQILQQATLLTTPEKK